MNVIKAVKNDLASDHTSGHAFLDSHRRLFYSYAAYVLIHSQRDNTPAHTELAKAQPITIILKLFKLAVRVTEIRYLVPAPSARLGRRVALTCSAPRNPPEWRGGRRKRALRAARVSFFEC